MAEKFVINLIDAFCLRHNETIRLLGTEYPAEKPLAETPYVIGVMLRSIWFPSGHHVPIVDSGPNAGVPVAMEAVVACQKTENGWIWVQLSPPTKEIIGGLLDQWGVSRNVWNFLEIGRDVNTVPAADNKVEPT